MKVVIDSNSLLSLVRYYLPFDKSGVLYDFVKIKFEIGEFCIIDRVLEQCEYIAQGIVLQKLVYLTEKEFLKTTKLPYKTENQLAPSPSKFLRQVDNQFVNGILRNKLSDTEYEVQKTKYMEDADMKMVICCLNLVKDGHEVVLVTEETVVSNDHKLFKKIPAISRQLNLTKLHYPNF